MRNDFTINVNRAGKAIWTQVPAQIDYMGQVEAAYYGGAAPYLRYKIFTTTLPYEGVIQGDLLIDQVNTDPVTLGNTHYRVINDPRFYPDGHHEIVADKVRGT